MAQLKRGMPRVRKRPLVSTHSPLYRAAQNEPAICDGPKCREKPAT